MHAIKVVCMNNPRHTSPRRKAGLDGMQSHPLCRTDFSCAGMTERWGPVSNAQNALRWVPLLGRNSLKVVSICNAWAHMHAYERQHVSLCNTLPHTSILLHLPTTWIHLVFLSRNFALILKHPLQYLRTKVNKNIHYCSIYFSSAHKPHPSQREGELGHAATDDHQETQLL